VYVISRIDQGSYSLDTRSLDPLLLEAKDTRYYWKDKPVKFATEEFLPVRIQLIYDGFSLTQPEHLFV